MLALMWGMMWLVIERAPGTPIGRSLRHALVVAPAAMLNRITRGHVLLAIALITGGALLVWLIGEEATRLIAMGSPEALSWLVMVDAASLIDVAAMALIVSTSVRLSAIRTRIGSLRRGPARPGTPRPRAPRTRAVRPDRNADNDEDSGSRPAFAA